MALRKKTARLEVLPGQPHPLGATLLGDGVNFSLFSRNATSVELLLFDHYDQETPTQIIPLEPPNHKTYYYWHAHVRGIGHGQVYAYRVDGPYQPEEGRRFNRHKLLLDPYALAVAYGANWSRAKAHGFFDNTASALKAAVVDLEGYDWEGDTPLQRPMEETIIYEMHVASLTAHVSANSAAPGTYAGVIEKIPYLKNLGVTAIELLPVQQFDSQEVMRVNPLTGDELENYWGYAPVAFCAPHLAYARSSDHRKVADEFRDMVKALHKAGIEVILDVVFNHTAENDETGPTISFRGLENEAYYILKQDRRYYHDYAGCGNTISANHSVVRRLIVDCLLRWVVDYHVDGFRFDLASVLSRNEYGEPLIGSPILWQIESEPALAGTKLMAEAWDAAGLYELGSFTGDRWAEWNGRFRDDIRRFIRGDLGMVRDFAWRMTGSFDIFRGKPSFASHRSINYVTCHDGFTLADLTTYNAKHNDVNGENNHDGAKENYSWNCGVEGETDDEDIQALRRRQQKNLLALLIMARGTPLLLGGDEFGRTQLGNNNAYCQNNAISWFDWRLLEENADLHRFVRGLIAFRGRHPTLTEDHLLVGKSYEDALTERVTFHGVHLDQPDWGHSSHSLAMRLAAVRDDVSVYLIANAYTESLTFALPDDVRWKRVIDTSLASPDDLVTEAVAPVMQSNRYQVGPRSVVILVEAQRGRA
ncbi:MAG: glycogen debranching protein GlgX [Anaerolineae bacterium]